MAISSDINITFYGGDRQLWSGGKISLLLLDPFSNKEKVLLRESTKPKTQTVLLRDIPIESGQIYSLIATATGYRKAAIFPLKPREQGVKHTAIMLLRNKPSPDFSDISFTLLKEHSPKIS
jgi:hypothetical protein